MQADASAITIPVYIKRLAAFPDCLDAQIVNAPEISMGIAMVNAGPTVANTDIFISCWSMGGASISTVSV